MAYDTVEQKIDDPKNGDAPLKTRIINDLRRAKSVKHEWIKEAEEDFEFAVGKQWKDEDKNALDKAGVPAMTINKIQPNLFLISGYERQNRTDFVAYPEGEEDSIKAEIATRLLKNSLKQCDGEYKSSEQFEDGVVCGEAWLDPFVDYTNDLINGDLRLKKSSPFAVFVDPDSVEYDLSDAEFVIKVSPNLSKDKLLKLFPDKREQIEKIKDGKLKLDLGQGESNDRQTLDYPNVGEEQKGDGTGEFNRECSYDLIEYQYKRYVSKFIVADKEVGQVTEAKDKAKADEYVNMVNEKAGTVVAKVIERIVPEIWIAAMVSDEVLDDYLSPFYPKWKNFTLIPFWAHKITTYIKNAKDAMIQGMVRSLKDPQRELNKRRSQELRILNSTANSGWLTEENTWKNPKVVETYGSTPGINLEYKTGKPKPERIEPSQLSQGHAQLAAENSQDMKEISGINADLLAMEDKSASGRAIHLRQQQGIVMLQRILDNYSRTKKLLGKFILSQLGELYSVESAMRVCGQAFIKENFSIPVMVPSTVNPQEQVPQVGPDGQMVMKVDEEGATAVFNQVLNDLELGKYDIKIDEATNSPTIKYANYLMLTEMASKGVPIPPDVLVGESMIGEASKQKINKAIATAMSAQKAMPAAKAG